MAVLADAHDEGDETLTLALSNAQGASIADAQATGTITKRRPDAEGVDGALRVHRVGAHARRGRAAAALWSGPTLAGPAGTPWA